MQRRIRASVKKVFDRRKISDYGPVEFKTHKATRQSEVLSIATRKPITVNKTTPLKNATEMMVRYGVRRVPVVDPGTERLLGILTSWDVIDFLGGGEKHNLIKDNIPKSINYSVGKMMHEHVLAIRENQTISDAIGFFIKNAIGGAPIINKKKKVVGILTEYDIIRLMSGIPSKFKVRDYMQKSVIAATPGMMIDDVSKEMMRNKFRRIPVIEGGRLKGMITAMDIIRSIATNKIFRPGLNVGDIMTRKVQSTALDTDIGSLVQTIDRTGVGAFPVLENGRIVGIITEHDVLKAMK